MLFLKDINSLISHTDENFPHLFFKSFVIKKQQPTKQTKSSTTGSEKLHFWVTNFHEIS